MSIPMLIKKVKQMHNATKNMDERELLFEVVQVLEDYDCVNTRLYGALREIHDLTYRNGLLAERISNENTSK